MPSIWAHLKFCPFVKSEKKNAKNASRSILMCFLLTIKSDPLEASSDFYVPIDQGILF